MHAKRPIAIALCAVLTLVGAREASSEPDILWGANGHPLASYPGVSIEEQLGLVRDLGMRSYRVDIADAAQVAGLRTIVQAAKAQGVTVLPVVTPKLDLAKESAESLEKAAYGLAFELVSSFKGEIPVWELGNEMENYAIIQPCEAQDDGKQYSCSYGPAGGVTPLEYFGPRWAKVSAVLKGMSRGAHDADPNAKRALGTAGWGHLGAFERMKADGIEWEISVWHMYGEDPEWAFKELVKYGKPIWVTEFNNHEGSTRSKEAQAQGLTRAIALIGDLQGTYDIEAAYLYELLDEPYWKDFEAHMGLVEIKKDGEGKWTLGERKPAYAEVKTLLKAYEAALAEVEISRRCEMQPAVSEATLRAQEVIAYAYCLALGREADGAGLNGWSAHREKGMPVEKIVADMLQSEESTHLYGLTQLSAQRYVAFMHRLLLDAEPEKQAHAQAVAELDGGKPRAEFLADLIGSKAFKERHPTLFAKLAPKPSPVAQAPASSIPREPPQAQRKCDLSILSRPLQFERGQVTYGYCLALGRWPDGGGQVSWTDERKKGVSLEKFLTALLQSDEFTGKYETDTLDHAGMVTLIYRVLLERDPDSAGLASYVSKLQTGAENVEQVIESILASDEFHTKHEALFSAQMPEKPRAQAQ